MGPTILLLLTGCYQEVHWVTCEGPTLEVADDEVAGDLGVSAEDVLAVIGGAFPFDAHRDDGRPVSGEVEVARGAGPARATDRTLVEHVARGSVGFGEVRTSEGLVTCTDTLEVPVDVALATDDGALALSLGGLATPRPSGSGGEPERFEANEEVDPVDLGATPASTDASAAASLSLEWTADGLDYVGVWMRLDDRAEWILETD